MVTDKRRLSLWAVGSSLWQRTAIVRRKDGHNTETLPQGKRGDYKQKLVICNKNSDCMEKTKIYKIKIVTSTNIRRMYF